MNWLENFRNAICWGNNLGIELLKVKNLGYLVMLAVAATVVVGLFLYLIDPNINSLSDGIWSAWVTVTHVGFGDVVPVSFAGRLLAALLILFGLVFFSIFTALVSVALIGKTLEELTGNVKENDMASSRPYDQEERILNELSKLHQGLDELKKQLSPDR